MRIHPTIRKQQIEKFQAILKENPIYIVKNFIVADNTMKNKTKTGKYKICFVGKTRLTEIYDDNFSWRIYNFKPFDEFFDVDSVDKTILIGKHI